jgi:hypothetical protein
MQAGPMKRINNQTHLRLFGWCFSANFFRFFPLFFLIFNRGRAATIFFKAKKIIK